MIIKDFLNQNRVFNAKAIIPFILNGLKSFKFDTSLNESGIQKVLWRLIRDHYVVPGSKLTKENLLKNATRNEIFKIIDKYPGTYLREIMEKLKLGSQEALWHLNLLIKFNLVRFTKIGRNNVYFNQKLPNTRDKQLFYLGNKDIGSIAQHLITSSGPLSINSIANELKLHFNTVNGHVQKLSELGLIAQKEENSQVLYSIDFEKFKETMDGIEAVKKAQSK